MEESNPVAGENVFSVGVGGASSAKEGRSEGLEFFDGVQIGGALFGYKAAVQITADADVFGVAGDLADMVDVVDDGFEGGGVLLWGGLSWNPAGEQHPGVKGDSDDGASLDEKADLWVVELALVRRGGTAGGMTGPNGAVEKFETFLKIFVCEVSDVENDSHLIHFVEKVSSTGGEDSFGIRAGGVDSSSIMRKTNGAKAVGIGFGQVV